MPGFAILRLRIAIPVVSGGYQFSQLTNDEIQRPPYLAASTVISEHRCDVCSCEGFRMPAIGSGAACTGGRRPKASKGGNRGTVMRRRRGLARLWGFEDWSLAAGPAAQGLADLVEGDKRALRIGIGG